MDTIAIIISGLGFILAILGAAYRSGIEAQKTRTLILESEARLQKELTKNYEETDKRIDLIEKEQAIHAEKINALENQRVA